MKCMRLIWVIALILFSMACKKKPAGTDDPVLKPEVISFAPTQGVPGSQVIITGRNFSTDAEVTFGGIKATVINARPTELTVTVPLLANSGKIKVNTATSGEDFVVIIGPSITDFSPKEGPLGTEVTITGRWFSSDPVVTMNGIPAAVKERTGTKIVITVPVNTTLTAHKIKVVFDSHVLETATAFTIREAGPFAVWENNGTNNTPTANIFIDGLGFAYKNKLYWGFTRFSWLQNEAEYLVYDPADARKQWILATAPPANMAPAEMQDATVVVKNDVIYLGTGLTPAASKKWWRFQPETNTATPLTDYPENTAGALSFVLNNTVYVGFGGVGKKLYKFNEAGNGSWDLSATGDFRELSNGNAMVLGGVAYLGRAIISAGERRKALFKFTPPGQQERVADMPDEVAMHATPSFTLNGKGYFVVDRNVWEYTPNAGMGAWRAVISSSGGPSIRHVAVIGQTVYGWTGTGAIYTFRFQ